MSPVYRLNILFEAGSGVALWAASDPAHKRFGHAVDPERLPLDGWLLAALAELTRRCEAVIPAGAPMVGHEPWAAPFAADVEALAVQLRATLGPEFAIDHEFPISGAPLTVGWNRRWVTRAAIGSLPMAALTGWLASAVAFEGFGDLSPFGRLVLTAMFGAFGLLFCGTAATYALARVRPQVVVALGPDGLHDRRLTREPIPWPAILSLTPLQKGGQLMLLLNVADPKAWPGPRHPLWAVNRMAARLAGGGGLAVNVTGLETDLSTLIDAIQRRAA